MNCIQAITSMQLKERGMQLALFKSGEGWIEQTIQNLRRFCAIRKAEGRREFRMEEFRHYIERNGLPLPASANAWGSVPRIGVKHDLIRATGRYEKATSPATHCHPVMTYKVL